MKKIIISIIILISILNISDLGASECTSFQYDKAEYFTQNFAEQIVDNKYDGGEDIVVSIERCNYNMYGKFFKLKINIKWHGRIFYSHTYEADGILTFDKDGSNPQFKVTWISGSLSNYLSNRNILGGTIGAIIILNSLDQQNQNSQE